MPTDENNIHARNLCKRFGSHTAVNDLSFDIKRGEIVGFLGPNGAGKSTTLRIMTGVIRASAGFLSVCGRSIPYHAEEIRREIGYMPENNPLPDEMRVIEYLRFRARLKGIPWRKRRQSVEDALEVCELHRKARRKIIGTLSKGFRQRVGIADAILGSPAITILDEPTIGLDPHQVIAIRRLLDSLRGKTTVIFSSHILSEVEISCDRVMILNQGRLVAQGTADQLRREFLPGSRYCLEASGDPETILNALKRLGESWEIKVDDQTNGDSQRFTLLNAENGQNGEAILQQLIREENLNIRSFQPMEPSLEDIFLTATRRSWEHSDSSLNPTRKPA